MHLKINVRSFYGLLPKKACIQDKQKKEWKSKRRSAVKTNKNSAFQSF